MFESLSGSLEDIFSRLSRKGRLSAQDVETASSEIRTSLLEADVSLEVVGRIIDSLKREALGEEVTRSVTPVQEIIKRTQDLLEEILSSPEGKRADDLLFSDRGELLVILMIGLQGSGKTTTTVKLANWLKNKSRKKVLLASSDIYRPQAKHQLRVMSEKIEVDVLREADETALETTIRAHKEARLGGYEALIIDTAGRTVIDDQLMEELRDIRGELGSCVSILVADSMLGQEAAHTAKSFNDAVGLDGIVLTRLDGDARGGAALSMSSVSGCGVWFSGTGEGVDSLELFDANRVAGRILGKGDIVALVEKAKEVVSEEESRKSLEKMSAGQFDLDDLCNQLLQLQKMGSMGALMGMIPGLKKLIKGKFADDNESSKMLIRQVGIIRAMTKKERKNPKIIHASRKKRIANGSGVQVSEVNKLLKQFQMMRKVMKKMAPDLKQEMAMVEKEGGQKDLQNLDIPEISRGLSGISGLGGMGNGGLRQAGRQNTELSRMLGLGKRR